MATYKTMSVLLFMCFTVVEAHDETLIESLVKRLELVEEKGRVQQHRLEQQDILLKAYEERMGKYETQLHEHTVRIQDLEEKLSNEAKDSTDTAAHEFPNVRKSPIPNESAPDNSVKSEHMLRSNANRIKKEIDQTNFQDGNIQENKPVVNRIVKQVAHGPIGFHATSDTYETTHSANHQHLIYKDVHLNLGNGFDGPFGAFRAPFAGVYIFSASIMSSANAQPFNRITITKNGGGIAKAFAHGDSGHYDQGSVTALVELAVGDLVWVEYATYSAGSGQKHSNFMGYLLHPM